MTTLNRIKYPRTLHIPSSHGATSDDKMLTAKQYVEFFQGRNIQITEKMDGENTTLYSDYLHARSLDSRHHPSRDWVKRFQSEIGHNIPDNWRICGENLFAKHSVSYDNLDSYFYGFSIWNENNICLSAEETSTWFTLLPYDIYRILELKFNIKHKYPTATLNLYDEIVVLINSGDLCTVDYKAFIKEVKTYNKNGR